MSNRSLTARQPSAPARRACILHRLGAPEQVIRLKGAVRPYREAVAPVVTGIAMIALTFWLSGWHVTHNWAQSGSLPNISEPIVANLFSAIGLIFVGLGVWNAVHRRQYREFTFCAQGMVIAEGESVAVFPYGGSDLDVARVDELAGHAVATHWVYRVSHSAEKVTVRTATDGAGAKELGDHLARRFQRRPWLAQDAVGFNNQFTQPTQPWVSDPAPAPAAIWR